MSNLIHDITKAAGAHKKRQRLGRGEASKGKTSGRGQKGAGARGGKPKRLGFEGGQTEIYRRFPQRGFSNALFKTRYHAVNVSMLERFEDGTVVDRDALKAAGLIPNTRLGVKILGQGELSKKLTIHANSYSRSAHKLVEAAGGTTLNAKGQPFQFAEPKNARLGRKLDKRLDALGIEKPSADGGSSDAATHDAKPTNAEAVTGDVGETPPSGDDASVTEAPESGAE
jgi:large subunit ribosomal protein L15